jgi:hypothetical protein
MLGLDSMRQVLSAGGGLVIDASRLPTETAVELASCARSGGAILILRNADFPPETATRIAAAGKGHVIFEFRS